MSNATYTTLHGDSFDEIAKLAPRSLHAVCTDPPYGVIEYSPEQVEKLREGKGGVWRIPPSFGGNTRKPLPRFSVLTEDQKQEVYAYFARLAETMKDKLVPGSHVLVAGNPVLQLYVQCAFRDAGYEIRGVIQRLYAGFRGGDRPKNAESEFPEVCVTPRGNYEPWMLFRLPISEKTVAQNLRKWGTGGLRMLSGNKPVPDVISSFRTPADEKSIADHPSLKPQHLMRIMTRMLLPLAQGIVLDPFMGSGSTIAACSRVGYTSLGIELDANYYRLATEVIPTLASILPEYDGSSLYVVQSGRSINVPVMDLFT